MPLDRNFRQMFKARGEEGKFLCVGLDPNRDRIEAAYTFGGPRPVSIVTSFLEEVISTTTELGRAFKPNRSHFKGAQGMEDLKWLMEFIRTAAPGVPIILDHKAGDIGASNDGYDDEAFDYFGADAMTVHHHMGGLTWAKSLARPDKTLFFVCRTSNPESDELQEQELALKSRPLQEFLEDKVADPNKFIDEMGWERQGERVLVPVYEHTALLAEHKWNLHGTAGLVVGATAPEQLARVRKIAPSLPILIPGFGTQHGKIDEVIPVAGDNFVASASSSILYAYEKRGGPFAQAAHDEAQDMHNQITAARGVPV